MTHLIKAPACGLVLLLSTLFGSSINASPDASELALIPHEGDRPTDAAIRRAQEQVPGSRLPVAAFERLGWAYVAKARESFDSGYYLLAEACADAIEKFSDKEVEAAEALLLRGHVFTNLHRFADAEAIARKLVSLRGIPFDHLLLGDALMEQGKLDEAITSYQAGVDLRPDLQSYARVGWIRWLIGDLPGAIEATERAVKAGTQQDTEALAWVLTRLASFQFLANDLHAARMVVDAGLRTQPDYPPALLLSGRMLLAQGDAPTALPQLRLAVKRNPMPDYQWVLIEALREAGLSDEAEKVEKKLHSVGQRIDPRTVALQLATTGETPSRAVELAKSELEHREDIFTHDAIAWALFAEGRIDEARDHMDKALVEGTEDGRLLLHAAAIYEGSGERGDTMEWLAVANEFSHTLLPSERQHLNALRKRHPTLTQSANQ